ncbi:MAG: indolepyruvate oxidoreductase subunit beta [Actinobacteria bacterium]|nr:indolepyruvate oxidoreductase subunit beta [Actinomycetota bacterium]
MALEKVDFVLAGVGGQGTILASDILVEVGLEAGYDVKKSEVHGMAQRGGGVESQVRWGEKVYSATVEKGEVDFLLGFEMLEVARWIDFLKPGGDVIVNRYRIPPPPVNMGVARYPDESEIQRLLLTRAGRLVWVDATDVARELGNAALSGVVLLGLLAVDLGMEPDLWLGVIDRLVPERFVALNREAFSRGAALGAEMLV